MESIAYALSPTQLFLLIIDNDNESRVTTQKTYWDDLDKYYEILKKSAVPNMKRSDSNGFYLHSSQLGAGICVNGYIFIEKINSLMTLNASLQVLIYINNYYGGS